MTLADPSLSLAATIVLAFVIGEFVIPDLVPNRRSPRLWSLPLYVGAFLWSFPDVGLWLGLALFVALAGCDLLDVGRGVPAAAKMTWGYAVVGLRLAVTFASIAVVMALPSLGQSRLALPIVVVRGMLWAAAYLFVLPGGTALVRHVLDAANPAWRALVPPPAALEAAVGAPQVKRSPDARLEIAAGSDENRPAAAGRAAELRRGRIIGNVERLIVTTLVCLGQYGAIGLVLAAKSLARFPQLSESRDFAEYYLIGTLVSMAVAIGTGLALTSALLGL